MTVVHEVNGQSCCMFIAIIRHSRKVGRHLPLTRTATPPAPQFWVASRVLAQSSFTLQNFGNARLYICPAMNIARLRWAVYNAGFGKSKVEGVASTVLTTAEHRASGSVSRRL